MADKEIAEFKGMKWSKRNTRFAIKDYQGKIPSAIEDGLGIRGLAMTAMNQT